MRSFAAALQLEIYWVYMRQLAREIVKESPHLANFISEGAGDPDAERLIQGFALLTSRLRYVIDDDFPEITLGMLARVWPMAMCPLPPTSVVQFLPTGKNKNYLGAMTLPAGTPVFAAREQQEIQFETCCPVHIEPLTVIDRQLSTTEDYSEITLTLHYSGNTAAWQSQPLDFFLGSDRQQAAQLALWIDYYLCDVQLRTQDKTITLRDSYPVSALWGTERQVPILPSPKIDRFSVLQLIMEYYYLPHVHDFVTINIQNGCRSVTLNKDQTFQLILRFEGNLTLSDISQAFLLGCAPVRQLEQMTSVAIPINSESSHYEIPLRADERLFKLNHVYMSTEPKHQARGQPCRYLPIEQFSPISHFLPDAEFLYYYQLSTECDILQRTRHELNFYDCHGERANHLPSQSIFCQFTGYRQQAANLDIGDINRPGENTTALTVRNITPVSACYPSMTEDRSAWPLFSGFSCSPWMMFKTHSVQDFLRVFDFSADRLMSKRLREHINGIVRLEHIPIDRLDRGIPVRGSKLILTLNPDCYTNEGEMYQFSVLMTRLMTFFISMETFLVMTVIDDHTKEVLWDFQDLMHGLHFCM
ncbi:MULTISPECIES: type VI secretion system baseplate subunit TssF [Photorhabdus]|nr:type VI secretion system baseplate subunit TssF [Photorhabdus asymbiotica]